MIGCECPVCTSGLERNSRLRSSALITVPTPDSDKNILIDTSSDLRQQALRTNLTRVDAILFTHPHADHIHGIDEIRAFNIKHREPIPCYGSTYTISRIRSMFDYIFEESDYKGWTPQLKVTTVEGPFKAAGLDVIPVDIEHGNMAIQGFRIGDIAYITDCSSIPQDSLKNLKGLKVLVLGALRHQKHHSHFTIEEAVEAAGMIKAERTILTHLGHTVDYIKDGEALPSGIELAYDGLEVEV